ncbi:hypothetical protein [Lewinella sp. LCG006]|uniref:hypothetical protein n=1 Tax=Lewinella sp. LCG006 TaxID=3231911 RepID=UPI00345F4AA8
MRIIGYRDSFALEWEIIRNVVVRNDHFTDDRGLPDIMHYHKNGCFELGFDPVGVFPKSHAIIIQK